MSATAAAEDVVAALSEVRAHASVLRGVLDDARRSAERRVWHVAPQTPAHAGNAWRREAAGRFSAQVRAAGAALALLDALEGRTGAMDEGDA